ncbi:MAG: transcription-repair coupling factor [Ignavibacteria bacterium]|nr:transcription-repair coupling factor [Ignavibacteria bacterium]
MPAVLDNTIKTMQNYTGYLHSQLPTIQKMLGATPAGGTLRVSALTGAAKSLAAITCSEQSKHVLILLPDVRRVQEAEVELSLLGHQDLVLAFSSYSATSLQERVTELGKRDKAILIATYQILTAQLPRQNEMVSQLLQIKTGSSMTYNELLEYLNLFNYQSGQFAEEPGSYAKRGAIIDFWSYSERVPVRLEFDGDFVESIRYFDPESQRSIDFAGHATLAPHFTPEEETECPPMRIFDYLDSPVVFFNSLEAEWAAVDIAPDEEDTPGTAVDGNFEDSLLFDIPPEKPETETAAAPDGIHAAALLQKYAAGLTARFIVEETLGSAVERVELGLSEAPAINSNYKILFNEITSFVQRGYTVYMAVENELQSTRLRSLFEDSKNKLEDFLDSGTLKIVMLPVKEGFVNKSEKLLLLTDYQVFNKPYRTRLPEKKKKQLKKNRALDAIKAGDFVVHEEYGIARYLGLESIHIGDVEQESMKLQYAEGGIVYVNLNYLHLVKRFSAKEGVSPTLSTLGTQDWSNKKKKAKRKIKEAAKELIDLYAKRKMSRGFPFSPDTTWQQELEASFMYEDTVDQSRVTSEVKTDMETATPMDRLVCGDVGFGKTEIAIRAAFKAVQDGKQAAILVPTTILAEQHYNTFSDRLSQFPVTIAALSRFQTKAEQTEIVQKLKDGAIDIVIGTHRILSKDVAFRDLGLLIIDEEHRFGVASKEKLRSYKLNVDILTMTATPIPRTLNLSLLGARDLSILATPPSNRQPVYSRVESFENANIRQWILNELKRDGQVYVVHDRVMTIQKFADYIKKLVPEANIAIAHGQMKPAQLEDVFHGFLHRKYNILLATKIIESGLDIPSVNTIIINRADRFGLAELHQLRGRVGRSDRQAYAYFLIPSRNALQKTTARRLQAVEDHTELGAGFQLAMRDLEIRGAGNLLGNEQTGFINEIGFDLYIKLINESVEELKQEEFQALFKDLPASKQLPETTIEAYFEIGIPKAYIPDQMDRLSYYTALFSVKGIDEIRELEEEMLDRFGVMPQLVKRLIISAELRFYASRAMFERVIIQQKRVLIILPRGTNEEYYQTSFMKLIGLINTKYPKQIQLVQSAESIKLQINQVFNVPERSIEYLIEFTKEVLEHY